MTDRWYDDILACPDCGGRLRLDADALACSSCPTRTPAAARPLDLRPRTRAIFDGSWPRVSDPTCRLESLSLDAPEPRYRGPAAVRDSAELFSALLAVRQAGGDFLDIGCGPRDQAAPAEHLGYRYVGVDVASTAADIRADAHALPFAPGAFDAVLAYAVLEHLHNLYIALAEVRRVMKPAGLFFGTVSQGEPFHDSYFHPTLWGLLAAADAAGLLVERVWPSRDTLAALAVMGRYPRSIRRLLAGLDRLHRAAPFLAPRRWLKWTERERRIDACHRAGSLCFVMRPDGPSESPRARRDELAP